MAENGVLGRLPAWPRKALNNSVISAEQAYRKPSVLHLLLGENREALRPGTQMPGEPGEGSSPPAPAAAAPSAPTPPAPAASAAPPAAATPPAVTGGTISAEVAAIVAQG